MSVLLENFLEIPELLKNNYKKEQEFNLFTVLRGSNDEVRLHSRFISELLNPRGSHNMGCTFFKAFLHSMNIEGFEIEDGYTVDKEWDHIDIFIRTPRKQAIIIENKIDAGDQEKQLSRYYHAMRNEQISEDNLYLLYLTKHGHHPQQQSLGDIPKDFLKSSNFKKLSYEGRIQTWLKACRKEAVEKPALRESISQYINLIEDLTNTSQDERYMNETKAFLRQQLSTGKKPSALIDDLNQARKLLHADLIAKLSTKIETIVMDENRSSQLALECSSSQENSAYDFVTEQQPFGVWFYPDGKDQRYSVGIEAFDGRSYVGVACLKDKYNTLHAQLAALMIEKCPDLKGQTKHMPKWKYISDPIELRQPTDENLILLMDEHCTDKLAKEISADLIRYIKEIQQGFNKPVN